MEAGEMRRRVGEARSGVLSTVTAEGRPHAVPCCFVLEGEVVYSAVDAKPKSTLALRRLDNLAANPAACLLVAIAATTTTGRSCGGSGWTAPAVC